MSTPHDRWADALLEALESHAADPLVDASAGLRDYPQEPGLDAFVALVMPTETPAAGLLDSVTLIDRAFRWATRSIERQESIHGLFRERARPITPREGLIVREVEGGQSAGLYFELSLRIYQALTSQPAAFVYALIASLELMGIHVRIRVYRDPEPTGDAAPKVVERNISPPPQATPTIIVNYAPTIVVHVHESSIEIETDADEAHQIEAREKPRVERELRGRPARRERRPR